MLHAPFTPMCIVANLRVARLCCSYSSTSSSPAYCILHTVPCVCKSPYHVSPIILFPNCKVFTSQLDLSKTAVLGVLRLNYSMQACDEEKLLGHLGVVLYEYLGEEYPEVLGSILGALKAIVNVIGMTKMTPPIKDLLPRLTPILKNRHEKVCMLAGAELHRDQSQHLHFCTVVTFSPALPLVVSRYILFCLAPYNCTAGTYCPALSLTTAQPAIGKMQCPA